MRAVGPWLCSSPGSPGGFSLIGPRCGAWGQDCRTPATVSERLEAPQPLAVAALVLVTSRQVCGGPRGGSPRRPAQWGSPLAPSCTKWLRICSDFGLGFPAAEPEGVFFWCVCACFPWSVAGLGTKDAVFKILTNSSSFFLLWTVLVGFLRNLCLPQGQSCSLRYSGKRSLGSRMNPGAAQSWVASGCPPPDGLCSSVGTPVWLCPWGCGSQSLGLLLAVLGPLLVDFCGATCWVLWGCRTQHPADRVDRVSVGSRLHGTSLNGSARESQSEWQKWFLAKTIQNAEAVRKPCVIL